MNKEKAIERLNQIEIETKELRKIINSKGKITDRIKSFEDACEELGMGRNKVFKGTVDEIAFKKLKVICRALNEGWEPNFNDTNEYKYYPYFDLRNNGFVFRGTDYYYHDWSSVPISLLFKSKDLASYCGTQFTSLYKEYYTAK